MDLENNTYRAAMDDKMHDIDISLTRTLVLSDVMVKLVRGYTLDPSDVHRLYKWELVFGGVGELFQNTRRFLGII